MTTRIEANSEQAKALQEVVNQKLIEDGLSSPGDTTLSEYLILMVANGKDQEAIARELSTDLLDLEDGDETAIHLVAWLFEQISIIQNRFNPSTQQQESQDNLSDYHMEGATQTTAQDQSDHRIPTGPKAMNNGKAGSGRMFNQINKQMDRGNDALHRIRGAGASGRINTHAGRNTRGGKPGQLQRNIDGLHRRANNNVQSLNQFPAFPGIASNAQGQVDQTQILQVLEQQAMIMSQLTQGFMSPGFMPQNGTRQNKTNRKARKNNNEQTDDATTVDAGESQQQQGNAEQTDNSKIICKFNLYCTKTDCPYAHQSPAAPPNVTLDLDTECTFGAACKNHKCAARHPSPAKKFEHQQSQDCKFGPFCQNAKCPFKHSSAKPCRNGGDCDAAGCTFFHSPIECKFSPCTNAHCIYKHKDGQRNKSNANVWTPDATGHISDRKFVNEEPEEVILPGGNEVQPQLESVGDNTVMT